MPIPSDGPIDGVLVWREVVRDHRDYTRCTFNRCTIILTPQGRGEFIDCEFIDCRFRTVTPRVSGSTAQQLTWIHRETQDKCAASRHTTTKAVKGH